MAVAETLTLQSGKTKPSTGTSELKINKLQHEELGVTRSTALTRHLRGNNGQRKTQGRNTQGSIEGRDTGGERSWE